MIQDFAKYKFPDKASKNVLEFDVNYSDDAEVKDAKIIRWKAGDKVGFIERKHLFEFLWFIGSSEDQRKMIPQTVRKVRYIEKTIGIKALKDIKKGEMINFTIKLDIPLSEEELISEVKRSNNKIIKPI